MHPDRFIAASAIAVIVTLVAIFSMRPLARRIGLVDRPSDRKRHNGRVPLIGGLCFFLGTLAGLTYFGYMDRFVVCLLAVGALILLAGLLDDLDDLSPRSRLFIQAGAAALVILTTGIYIDGGGYLFGNEEFRLHALGIPLTIVAVVGLINAFNMLDGIDGLAAGLAIVSIISILAFMGVGWPTVGVALLLQILAATLVPYMCVNLGWPDGRKIFMGDAGSTLIGFLVAWSLIFLSQRGASQLAPVDVLWCVALPVVDTLAVMYRRIRSGRSPFNPDRQHLHHLLLNVGCSPRQTLALLIGLSALMAGAGYALRDAPELTSLIAFTTALVIYVSFGPWIVASMGPTTRAVPAEAESPNARGHRHASRLRLSERGLRDHGLTERAQPRGHYFGARSLSTKPGVPAAARRPTAPVSPARDSVNGMAYGSAIATAPARAPGAVVRLLCVLDASPEGLKIAPIVQQLSRDDRFDLKICVTALPNHGSRQMLRLFDVRPDHVLDVLAPEKELTDMASAPVRGMKRVLGECKPDVVLIHGDALTTLAATLAAHFQNIPVACIHSGSAAGGALASQESDHAVRKITRNLISLHFASTESAGRELIVAGVPEGRIAVTEDERTDAARAGLAVRRRDIGSREDMAQRFAFLRADRPLVLVAHRAEPEDSIGGIGGTLALLAARRPDVDIVCPLHPASRERQSPNPQWDLPNLHLVQPLDYLAFSYLLNAAYLVLAGSHEFQQEAALWNKPMLMVRGAAACPGAFDPGGDPRSGIESETLAGCVMTLLSDNRAYEAMCFAAGPGGDRNAGLRIIQALASLPQRASSLAA